MKSVKSDVFYFTHERNDFYRRVNICQWNDGWRSSFGRKVTRDRLSCSLSMTVRTHLNGEQRETIVPSHAIRQNPQTAAQNRRDCLSRWTAGARKKKNRVDLQHQSRLFPARGLRLWKAEFHAQNLFRARSPVDASIASSQQQRDIDSTRVNK